MMANPFVANYFCQICGSPTLREVPGFSDLARITSDCRPFASGGMLTVCGECGAVQKAPTKAWLSEISEIYSGYAAYYQSGGDEQIIFDRSSGLPRRRSDVLVERLSNVGSLPVKGSVLDVGCGNGVTLASISRMMPGWQLNGFEIGEGNLPRLSAIPGFCHLYTGSLASIDKGFDLVTMIHSLEHFLAPQEALRMLHGGACGNYLFVEVCNIDENPFDILVADHLMHFSPATLSRLLLRAGFSTVLAATDWVAKEISLLATTGPTNTSPSIFQDGVDSERAYQRVSDYVQWLRNLRQSALDAAATSDSFGLFGTSIAATWLAPQLDDKVEFFVDEDSSRVGRMHLGCPIIHPNDIPPDAVVFLALAPSVANDLVRRFVHLQCRLVVAQA